MLARWMVDAVSAPARDAALQCAELGEGSRMIEEFDAAAIEQRQKLFVQIIFGTLGRLVFDPMFAETLAGPFTRVLVPSSLSECHSSARVRLRQQRPTPG